MLYLDTSALVPLLVSEARSAQVRSWLPAQRPGNVGLSSWTLVEFGSVMGLKVRRSELTAGAAGRSIVACEALAKGMVKLVPTEADFLTAADLLARDYGLGLRGGDALHLAIGLNHGVAAIVTFDAKLFRAGSSLGVRCAEPS
jgi:uncharacterized protein